MQFFVISVITGSILQKKFPFTLESDEVLLGLNGVSLPSLADSLPSFDDSSTLTNLLNPQGALSTYIRIRGGSVQEIFWQPKGISLFHALKSVHELEISRKIANRGQDCLPLMNPEISVYQYNDV